MDARTLWDAEAATFDVEPDHGLADEGTRLAWRELLLGALPAPPARVADLGCGTGTLAVLLAGCGFAVDGLDVSPAMLGRAREKASRAGVEVSLTVGDASAPELEPASYDVVLGRHVLWTMPDPAVALARWVTLLRPGGRAVLVEGRWGTGAGITAEECAGLVDAVGLRPVVRPMPEPVFWGGPVADERYLVVAQ